MKQRSFTIALLFMVLSACKNNTSQVTIPSNDLIKTIDDSTGSYLTNSYDPESIINDSARQGMNTLEDPTKLISDSTNPTKNSSGKMEDPAQLIIDSDPLEGMDNSERLNPLHGASGHRCDFPVGSDIATAPKTIGMSLCE